MDYCNDLNLSLKVLFYFWILNQTLNVIGQFTIFNILYIKSNDDVLQGISKLDYLLKVSIFQYVKCPEKSTLLPSLETEKTNTNSINTEVNSEELNLHS